MKTLFFSLFIVASLAINAQIPKKANTIIITDSLSQIDFYNKVNDALFENGYGILNSDKSQGTITTTEKSFQNGVIKLNILIKDKKILIRGDFKSDIEIELNGVTASASWASIQNTGMKKSVYQNAWFELLKFTDNISGTKEYLVR